MTAITSNLLRNLKTELKKADEIWVAVGLLNNAGLENILQAIPKACRLNFIVGIDLPTDPKALSKLLSLKGKRTITAQILTEEFFHPKVYIIKSVGKYIAFVGSANCTTGGLEKNLEMTIATKESITCKTLLNWFENVLLPKSTPITLDFIKNYKPKYERRVK